MSTFIATDIQYRPEDRKIWVRGGDSNVEPRSNNWCSFDRSDLLLASLVAGTVKLPYNNTFAKEISTAFENVEKRHLAQFETRLNSFDNAMCPSNPYSLYMFREYSYNPDKKEYFKEAYSNLPIYSADYQKVRLIELIAAQEVFDEGVLFYKENEKLFLDEVLRNKK